MALSKAISSEQLAALASLNDLAALRGQAVWLCGGGLRDLLLGRTPGDLDLAAEGDALALGLAWAKRSKARFIALDPDHQNSRISFGSFYMDLNGLRAADLSGDLQRRDFTLNALALGLDNFLAGIRRVIDPTGGLEDLEQGILRAAGPESLSQDPLRVLRAFRFMASHDIGFSAELEPELTRWAPGLSAIAKERLAQEWLILSAAPQAARALRNLERLQVLPHLWPELEAGRGMAQSPYHHLDVYEHSLACALAVAGLIRDEMSFPPATRAEVQDYCSPARKRSLLLSAALLHDLGKPSTQKEKEPGWSSFYRHDVMGAELAKEACLRMGFSKADSATVSGLVAGHMRPFQLLAVQSKSELSKRAVRRLIESAGPDLVGLFMLALGDTLAGKGPMRPADAEERLMALMAQVLELRDRELAAALAAPPLLDGKVLMQALDLAPGPKVGELLKAIREAQLDGSIHTATEAIALAKTL